MSPQPAPRPDSPPAPRSSCGGGNCGCGSLDRREFIRLAGLGAAALSSFGSGLAAVAGPFSAADTVDHFVPIDKRLHPDWLKLLVAPGERTWYDGSDLKTIGMPVGGIAAGQLYLAGDGRLVHWDIFNQHIQTGFGDKSYDYRTVDSPLNQGFALRVQSGDQVVVRGLDCHGFPSVRFSGEYPLGTVEYRDPGVPVRVTMEAFSPFIPLNSADSALPATFLQFTVQNTSAQAVEVTLAGWLENGVSCVSAEDLYGLRRFEVVREEGLTLLLGSARAVEPPVANRPPIVLADFEGKDYGSWKAEGTAFGAAPTHGALEGQSPVSGFEGQGLANSFSGGDSSQGKLVSPTFTIDRKFLSFLIGGGMHPNETCLNLVVDGKVVRTATGKSQEKLECENWNVKNLAGKEAHLEIVDRFSGGWGHVNVDQIELRDTPKNGAQGPLEARADFGTMGLALLASGDALTSTSLRNGHSPAELFAGGGLAHDPQEERPLDATLCGGLGKRVHLEPGQQQQITFALVWCFPNRPDHGNFYATRFANAAAVARYLATNQERLVGQTRLWHATWYGSSLPHWLLDRLFSTASILASSTCQWWKNGRFWAWEGVGCCEGTCAHVWNYEHALARLFPNLERTVREMQDFNPKAGFVEQSGAIYFRGECLTLWAGDSQGGTILKALREHQMSPDDAFLKRNWPRIRKALEFLIHEDGDGDGLIEGSQHNTYDIFFFGANTMVGSLYLAALRAGETMALELGDQEFAAQCRKIFERGREEAVKQLYNGEYFIQKVDLEKHPKDQYADGCLADQLFGQGWAHQVGLGYLYPPETVHSALRSIWTYNWAPNVGPQNLAHPPQRWFARPGEAGLFTCTWPKSKHLGTNSVLYRDEIWTGIEYQVAGHLAWEGMLTEALAICRGVHERYHPAKHNPWNEVECGDHYARAMASYGVFLALCGFEYHGPVRHLGFAPRMTPEAFEAAFTAAEGWGTLRQHRTASQQTNRLELKWGQLELRTLALELPEKASAAATTITLAGQALEAQVKQEGRRVLITFPKTVVVPTEQSLEVQLTIG